MLTLKDVRCKLYYIQYWYSRKITFIYLSTCIQVNKEWFCFKWIVFNCHFSWSIEGSWNYLEWWTHKFIERSWCITPRIPLSLCPTAFIINFLIILLLSLSLEVSFSIEVKTSLATDDIFSPLEAYLVENSFSIQYIKGYVNIRCAANLHFIHLHLFFHQT